MIMGIPRQGKVVFILGQGTGRVKNFRQNNYDNVYTRKWHKHTLLLDKRADLHIWISTLSMKPNNLSADYVLIKVLCIDEV